MVQGEIQVEELAIRAEFVRLFTSHSEPIHLFTEA